MQKIFEKLQNKKILVTGGAGFIGSHLCKTLLDYGATVLCLDNLSNGSLSNIEDLIKSERFHFIKGDILNFETCMEATCSVDFVSHQAALGSVPRSIENPINSNLTNVNGFLNVLFSSHKNNVKKVIYASSSSVYGDSEELPKKENNIGSPLSPYAVTKFVNELYASNFKLIYNLDSIGLRYFNVFGQRQDPNGPYAAVIPIFAKKLINNESPIINGDGSFSRDFTYVRNVVNANILAFFSKDQANNKVYNIACGNRITIIKLFETLKKHLSEYKNNIIDIKPIFGPERKGDVNHSFASIHNSKKFLNYDPVFSFDDGIKETVDWYWNNLKK